MNFTTRLCSPVANVPLLKRFLFACPICAKEMTKSKEKLSFLSWCISLGKMGIYPSRSRLCMFGKPIGRSGPFGYLLSLLELLWEEGAGVALTQITTAKPIKFMKTT